METQKKSYIQLMKRILRNLDNPDHVRLTKKEWGIISTIMSIAVCFPLSVLVGIVWLIDPKEESIFLFMLGPWIIAPIIFIAIYAYNYYKPKRNDKVINRLFGLVETDVPTLPKSGCSYTFTKYDFIFDIYFHIEPIYLPNGNKKGHVELILMNMIFDYDYESIQEYNALVEEMHAYLHDKQIGSHIRIGYNILGISLKLKAMTPELIKKIVDEFIYLTERFNLHPITWEKYAKCIERVEILLEK